MKEVIIGVIAFIFAIAYNVALLILNMESANGKFVNISTLLMTANTLKDMTILTIVLYNIFLNSSFSCNEYAPSTIMLYITANMPAIVSVIISFILFPPSNYILVLFLTNVNWIWKIFLIFYFDNCLAFFSEYLFSCYAINISVV